MTDLAMPELQRALVDAARRQIQITAHGAAHPPAAAPGVPAAPVPLAGAAGGAGARPRRRGRGGRCQIDRNRIALPVAPRVRQPGRRTRQRNSRQRPPADALGTRSARRAPLGHEGAEHDPRGRLPAGRPAARREARGGRSGRRFRQRRPRPRTPSEHERRTAQLLPAGWSRPDLQERHDQEPGRERRPGRALRTTRHLRPLPPGDLRHLPARGRARPLLRDARSGRDQRHLLGRLHESYGRHRRVRRCVSDRQTRNDPPLLGRRRGP